MYGDTVTLFNFHEGSGVWYPSVFMGADLGASRSSSHTTEGEQSIDTTLLILHCSTDKAFRTADGIEKHYLSPKAYALCQDPAVHITFRPQCDFLYAGAFEDLTPVAEDEFDEGLYHQMNDTHDGVYKITSASFYGLLPHFEIEGR